MSVWGGADPKHRIAFILFAQLVQGAVLVLGGVAPSATLITIAAFFFMMGLPMILSTNQAIWQSKVPPDLQGRVFAIRSMIMGASVPVALIVAGPLADHVFEPLMREGGPLAASVGRWIGVGPGRGSGLFMIVLGLLSLLSVIAGFRSRSLRNLNEEIPDAVEGTPAGGPVPAPSGADEPGRAREERASAAVRLGLLPAALLFAFLVAGATGAILLDRRTPPVVAESAPATEFSAVRAMRHIPRIAQQPHPSGTAAHAVVRDGLVAQLQALGLETQVQRTESVLARPRTVQVATVENVVARLAGTQPGQAILLVAHYDSVPTGPGASDDASAVAALLETARALKAGPPLRNDVIFLFSDCEETGLHGARAFVNQHPWAHEAKVVLNFDARGNSGPVYMFQTGDRNGWWIRRFLESAPWPAASCC